MRTRSKLILTAVAAAAMLAMAVGSASARNISTSSQRYLIKWAALEFTAGGATVRCPVTLDGSFVERTIPKITNSRIGNIRNTAIETCTGGTATILNETLPWETTYTGFTGTLPNITTVSLSLIGARFQVHPSGLPTCLAGTTSRSPGKGIANVSSGRITSLRADENARIPLGGGFLCEIAGESFFAGTATVDNGGIEATPITITLI